MDIFVATITIQAKHFENGELGIYIFTTAVVVYPLSARFVHIRTHQHTPVLRID